MVASSNSYALAETAAPAAEICQALSADEAAALPAAVDALTRDLAPAGGTDAEDAVATLLGQQIGLIRPNLGEQGKAEWIRLAFLDLAPLPSALVLEGLRRARRTCRFEGDVVPSVLEYVEPRIDRLQAELRTVETILAACRENGRKRQ